MIYPTIKDLTKDQNYNRYEIAIATAKCARMITNEYVRQREEAERSMTGNKETDKPLTALIDKEVRDEKAVKIAISRIHRGEYTVVHKDPAEQEREEQAILGSLNAADKPFYDPMEDKELADETADDEAPEDAEDESAEDADEDFVEA